MGFAIELTDEQWHRVADLFDPPGRRGAPARIPRRPMVNAMLFLARTGCQWGYLPERLGPWGAGWPEGGRGGARPPAAASRARRGREPIPSMVMIDAQTVKGGRYGPTFHNAGGRGGR